MIGYVLVGQQGAMVVVGRGEGFASGFKTFCEPFDGVVEGYSSLNYREVRGGKFMVYSDAQMGYAFESFLKLNAWFDGFGWGESFYFNNVATPVPVHGYAKADPTIVTACFSVGDTFVSDTFVKFLGAQSEVDRANILDKTFSVSFSGVFFAFNKQKAVIYNLSVTRYSLLYRTMLRLWGLGSFRFSSVAANEGLLVDDFIELMSAYVDDLSELLLSHGIEGSSGNVLALHNFSHFSQSDYELSSYIVKLGFGRKFSTKADRWLDLVGRGVTVDFVKTLRLCSLNVVEGDHLDELFDLWGSVPLSWFFKLHAREFSKKV